MPDPLTIDAHHHFWRYDPVQYDWIDDAMAVIRRDFAPQHLREAMAGANVDGVVSVQARQTLAETDWLLELADQHDWIRGVVGWVPLASDELPAELERLADHPALKAVRHVVQGEPDGFLAGAAFNRGIDALAQHELVYDLLVVERQLAETIAFVDRHPEQVFVLDHIAKPLIRDAVVEPWATLIGRLAGRPNVYCKLSGLVTEADYDRWTDEQLRPYFDTVLEAFTPARLMFGSDWPVCLVACAYDRWRETVGRMIAPLSPDEQAAILARTAVEAYRL